VTSIEWTDEVWNPVTGCTRVSEGCRHCYIERTPPFRKSGRTVGDPIQLHPERLDAPLHWRKPRRVFVNSLSDLFHEDVPDGFIDDVFEVMWESDVHVFQVLTKRPKRMLEYISRSAFLSNDPMSHVHLGVSVEDQATADERIPILLQTPAAVRWVSAEPLLGAVELDSLPSVSGIGRYFDALSNAGWQGSDFFGGLDWVVVGGESGPKARPCDVAWIRSIVRQCRAAQVPCFVKQLGGRPYAVEGSVDAQEWGAFDDAVAPMDDCGQIHCRDRKGGEPSEWPEDLRVREYPR